MKRLLLATAVLALALMGGAGYMIVGLGLGTTPEVWRCWLAPNPPDARWSARVVAAQCRDYLQPAFGQQAVWAALRNQTFEELDAQLNALLDAHATGQLSEVTASQAWWPFTYTDSWTEKAIGAWRKQLPNSHFAKAAEGIQLAEKAWSARGGEIGRNVTEEQWDEARKHAHHAIPLLKEAVASEPRLLPAWSVLIGLGMLTNDPSLKDRSLEGAVSAYPDAYFPRLKYVVSLQPMWGGSTEAMSRFVTESRGLMQDNPRWELLKARAELLAQWPETNQEDAEDIVARAAASIREAPELDTLSTLVHYENYERLEYNSALAYADQALRFRPTHLGFLRSRALALTELKRHGEALAAIDAALRVSTLDLNLLEEARWHARMARDLDAQERYLLRALEIDPDHFDNRRRLAGLYLYNFIRVEDASREVDRLLEARPESGAAWLLRADVLVETGEPGRREALERFVEFADPDDPEQAQALPKVQAWLAQQGAPDDG